MHVYALDLHTTLTLSHPSQHALPGKIHDSISEYTTLVYHSITQFDPPKLPDLVHSLPAALQPAPPPPPPPPSTLQRLGDMAQQHRSAILWVSAAGAGSAIVATYALQRRQVVLREPELRGGRRAEAVGESSSRLSRRSPVRKLIPC